MANEIAIIEFINENKQRILDRLPKLNEWLTPEIWMGFLIDLAKRRDLQQAYDENRESVLQAFLTLADWGLKPDGEEAFINVREIDGAKTAMAQWMYKGGIRRAKEVGAIDHAVPDVVREGDGLEEYTDEKGRHLKHTRDILKSSTKRKILGAYCLFWLPNGLMDYELLDRDDIDACSEASRRSMRGKTSPAWQNFPGEQAKKSAVRRGLKRMQGSSKSLDSMLKAPEYDAETTATDVGELTDDETPRAVSPHSESSQKNPVEASQGGLTASAALSGGAGRHSEGGREKANALPSYTEEGQGSPGAGEQQEGAAPDAPADKDERAMISQLFNACKAPFPRKLKALKDNVPGFTTIEDLRTSQLQACEDVLRAL